VEGIVNVVRTRNGSALGTLTVTTITPAERDILQEQAFVRMISLERKRSERSRKPFVLMLLDMGRPLAAGKADKALAKIMAALAVATRETDVTGWYKHSFIVGVMFTEIGADDRDRVVSTMVARVSETLRSHLTAEQFQQLSVSFHVYPEDWDHDASTRPSNPALYPDLSDRDKTRQGIDALKRAMDIGGSMLALVGLSPVFLAIAAAIKLTSKGPIFFRQRRIGQYGAPFVFLKFRSMYVNNDSAIHREYVKKLIAGTAQANSAEGDGEKVYKLTRDPRITRVGAFLRKTSLDELPQFLNVLMGEMSLVGPRPPVPYEVEAYDVWHRRRLLEAKPGITGLWQVSGRCRVKFDDMVRLDLHYARYRSPWLDLKILARTPGAVVTGDGAF
jgi:lipopolysaccharide/colanic/teichoic acid biosynthesis glycosyltransferase